jgi:hypothetical protein
MAVLAGADLQGQHAGRFEPGLAVPFGQRQQTRPARMNSFSPARWRRGIRAAVFTCGSAH